MPKNHAKQIGSTDGSVGISNIETPDGLGVKIDNVNQSLWKYIKQHKLWEVILIIPLIVAWEIFMIFLCTQYFRSNNPSSSRVIGYLIALPFIGVFGLLYKIKKQFEDAFLEEFSRANGYSFNKTGSVDEAYGTIFRLNGRQRISDIISGTYNNNSLRLFLYELVNREGSRNQVRYIDTVIELDLHGKLPNLLMVNKKSRYGQLDFAKSFGIKNTFSLEGDFNQYFTLYGQPDNQIEALEIFSPDVMALMRSESRQYTVEFSCNRIYIYANGFITNSRDLTQIFTLAKKLIDKIAPIAARLQNDSAIIATPINLSQPRKDRHIIDNVIIAIIILFGIAAGAFIRINEGLVNGGSSSNISDAENVSAAFITDMQQKKFTAAINLESPKLQQLDIKSPGVLSDLMSYVSSAGAPSVIDKKVYSPSGDVVIVVYEFKESNDDLYLKLWLENKSQWVVYGHESSENPLYANDMN